MPRFAGVPVDPQAPRGPRFAGTPVPAAPPDFANVTGDSRSTEAYATTDRKADAAPDPTANMGAGQRLAAGFGQSYANAVRGSAQALAENSVGNLSALDAGLRALGLDRAADAIARTVGAPVADARRGMQRRVDEARTLDAPLDATGAGTVGNVVGNVSQLLLPGVALRGTAAGRALLPTTVRGNAAQGAALGALQPTATGESRGLNTLASGVAGGVIPGAVKGAQAVRQAAGRVLNPSRAAAENAVRTIQREAGNPEALMRPNPSRVPGAVPRTLFEESQDPGVARLETMSRGQGGGWGERDIAANAQRIAALRGFAGDEDTLAQAVRARSEAATPHLRAATTGSQPMAEAVAALDAGEAVEAGGYTLRRQGPVIIASPSGAAGGAAVLTPSDVRPFLKWAGVADDQPAPTVDTAPILSQLDALRERYTGNPQMQAALAAARTQVDATGGNLGYLENARQFMGNQIAGTADGSMVRLPDMIAAKEATTEAMREASPAFGQYLDTWRDMSGPINRMQTGQALIERGGSGRLDPTSGVPILAPDRFGRLARNLDDVAAQATGFPRANGAQVLGAENVATVEAVAEDLARQASRAALGHGGGSQTASQQQLAQRLGGRALATLTRAAPWIGEVARELDAQANKRLSLALERVLVNPAEYRAIAAGLNAQDRALLGNALRQIGGASGAAAAPALAQ